MQTSHLWAIQNQPLRGEDFITFIQEPHWHIDYLVGCSTPVEIWYSTDHGKLEHKWAELPEGSKRFRVPIPRVGSSDYHRNRASHRFYSKE